jgi:ABC-2 type transport system ATP-binding protein
LARTLIHDPQVLILDEPAAGLDPRARIELRELVLALARELNKTILISSHILTELGEICDAVVIIEAGKILAGGTMDDLQQMTRKARAQATASTIVVRLASTADAALTERVAKWLLEQPLVHQVREMPSRLSIDFAGDESAQVVLLQSLSQQGFPVVEFFSQGESLEEAFMEITKGIMQ